MYTKPVSNAARDSPKTIRYNRGPVMYFASSSGSAVDVLEIFFSSLNRRSSLIVRSAGFSVVNDIDVTDN